MNKPPWSVCVYRRLLGAAFGLGEPITLSTPPCCRAKIAALKSLAHEKDRTEAGAPFAKWQI